MSKKMNFNESLAATHPDVAKEWNTSMNENLTPAEVTAHSRKSVWWTCSECGTSYNEKVYEHVKTHECPECTFRKGANHIRYYDVSKMTPHEMMEDYFAEEEMNMGEKVSCFPETEDGMLDFSQVSLEDMLSGKCDAMIAEAIRREREEGAMSFIGEEDINTPEEVSRENSEKVIILMEAWEKAEEEAEEA